MNTTLKNDLIDKYRASIAERYNYEAIRYDKNFPENFSKETVEELQTFFLTNLYPPPEQREKLDAAFAQLESYLKNPVKVWGLLGNIAAAVFQFGLQFPAAMRTGVVALRTHSTARQFEDSLLQSAEAHRYRAPLTQEQFNRCLADLETPLLEKFVGELTDLFLSATDASLMQKTIAILQDVLRRMKERKDLYDKNDHEAIQLAIAILQDGFHLLSPLDEKRKKELVHFVSYNEMTFIKRLKKGA